MSESDFEKPDDQAVKSPFVDASESPAKQSEAESPDVIPVTDSATLAIELDAANDRPNCRFNVWSRFPFGGRWRSAQCIASDAGHQDGKY